MPKKPINYGKLFAIQHEIEGRLKELCPQLDHKSGIYFYTRVDETGKYAYIGKSVDCCQRCVSHTLGNQQRIDGSIKKRGLYSLINQGGWKLNVLYYPEQFLDEKEAYYIDLYKQHGYTLYNIESGGTLGKTIIGDRKTSKGYRDGVDYGYLKARRDVSKWFDKNLICAINGKETVNKLKAYNKFKLFIDLDKNEEESE